MTKRVRGTNRTHLPIQPDWPDGVQLMGLLERFRRTPPAPPGAPPDTPELAPLPAEAEVELGVLLQFLHHADGFALALAEVNARPFEDELIQLAQARSDTAIAVVDATEVGWGPGLGSRLVELSRGATAVFLTGLDLVVAPGAAEQPALSQLDLARNRLAAELGVPLVIWAPAYVLAELPFRAPNLWSLAIDRFVFASDGGRARDGADHARSGAGAIAVDYGRERSRLEELLAEVGARGRADVLAELRKRLGDIAGMQDRYDDADTLLRDALNHYRTIGDRHGEANTLKSLGDIARMQNRYDDADTLLRDALNHYRTIGDRRGEANALLSLGRLASATGERNEARSRLLEAERLYRDIGDTRWAGIARQESLLLGAP